MQPDQLIAELLARGDMNDETVVDLNRMLEAYRAGTLDPDDESYLRALHARILDRAPEPELADTPSASAVRLDGLTIEEWRDRALKAEGELAQVEDAARNG
jgi:hypothetical protein